VLNFHWEEPLERGSPAVFAFFRLNPLANSRLHLAHPQLLGELHYRQRMSADHLINFSSGRRWGVETFNSGLKRVLGSTLSSRKSSNLLQEAAFKFLTSALSLRGFMMHKTAFYRAKTSPSLLCQKNCINIFIKSWIFGGLSIIVLIEP
jgi:hypothetical protein